ncbi:MAG: Flp family type IVb pilin [Alphaproteobacteria bacterium]|nr:MAG: Flp family type IVb pilin [Alphaproteobacteria bacterium]
MNDMVLKFFARLATDDRGLTAVEYAVLGAIVVAGIGLVGGQFQTNLGTAFGKLFTGGK